MQVFTSATTCGPNAAGALSVAAGASARARTIPALVFDRQFLTLPRQSQDTRKESRRNHFGTWFENITQGGGGADESSTHGCDEGQGREEEARTRACLAQGGGGCAGGGGGGGAREARATQPAGG